MHLDANCLFVETTIEKEGNFFFFLGGTHQNKLKMPKTPPISFALARPYINYVTSWNYAYHTALQL